MYKIKLLEQQNHIEIQILKETTFAKQLLSNGKLKALRKSDLKFNIAGKIRNLSAGNGDRIKSGQVIAILDQFEYNQQLTQAQTSYKKSGCVIILNVKSETVHCNFERK